MIAYVAGISTIVWLPQFPSLLILPILVTPLFFWRRIPITFIAFISGVVWSLLWGHWQMAHRLEASSLKSDWEVTGVVKGLPQIQGRQLRFLFQLDAITPLKGVELKSSTPRLLRLSWFNAPVAVKPEQRLRLTVRLKAPHGYANPHGFDYELWLLAQGIDATGYVRQWHRTVLSEGCLVDCQRGRMAEFVDERYGPLAPLVLAITLGIRDQFEDAQWQQLRATGTIHLAVISGLHLGFIVGLCLLVFKGLSYVVAPRVLRPAEVIFICVAAFAYMQLAGAGLPTQRAFIMVAVFLLARWRLWHIDLWSRWWLAMAIVLTVTPVAVHQAGFWLSFGAVAVLLWFAGYKLRDLIGWRIQFGIFLGMTPILIWLFGGFSMVAPLVNLVAIPLMALTLTVTVLDLFLASIGVSVLLPIVEGLIGFFWWLIEFAAGFQTDIWRPPAPSVLYLLLALFGSFLLIQPRGMPLRWLGVLLWLPMLLGGVKEVRPLGFEAWVFDVGQGTAVLVQADGRYMLYDTGPGFPSGHSAYRHTLESYFYAAGIQKLDHLILSHNDLDHTGGHSELLKQLNVETGSTGSLKIGELYGYQQCKPGDTWHWNDVVFTVLAGGDAQSDNNSSCVLRIEDSACSLLLTGDIDQQMERSLVSGLKPVTWLLASHHGSKTGTGRSFLQALQPELVVFSAGYANHFGHPAKEVVARVEQQGAQHRLTASQGALYLRSNGRKCHTESWRDIRRRFWSGY